VAEEMVFTEIGGPAAKILYEAPKKARISEWLSSEDVGLPWTSINVHPPGISAIYE
jgi:hypothetical protein